MEADREAMEAYSEKMEVDPEEMKSVAERQEVPKEETAVEMIRALKEQYGDWHLAVGCHQQPKKRAQGDGGFWKKSATARRHMTRHAIPAPHKGHGRQ
jgi:hypothetical protein